MTKNKQTYKTKTTNDKKPIAIIRKKNVFECVTKATQKQNSFINPSKQMEVNHNELKKTKTTHLTKKFLYFTTLTTIPHKIQPYLR